MVRGMKYLAPILLAFILAASGCRRDRGRAQRETAPGKVPASTVVQKTVIIPDDAADKPAVEPNPSGRALVAAAPSPAAPGTTAPTMTASAASAHGPSAPKTKRSTGSKFTSATQVKGEMPSGTKPKRAARVYEDPWRIVAGMSYKEMIRRFGPASLSVTAVPDRSTLSYLRPKHHVQVELDGGTVIAVTGTGLQ